MKMLGLNLTNDIYLYYITREEFKNLSNYREISISGSNT